MNGAVYPIPTADESAFELHKSEEEQPILLVITGETAYVKITELILLNENSSVQRKLAKSAKILV